MVKETKLIAYLIQAHYQHKHFFDLIFQLNHKRVCFFVHIDKKSNQENFKNKIKDLHNVYFVKNRVNVIWGGFSQVQATLAMIELALNSPYDFRYFVLLSGACFPIKSNEYIFNFFEKNKNDYIDIHSISEEYQKYKYLYSMIIRKYIRKARINKKQYKKTKNFTHYFKHKLFLKIPFLLAKKKVRYYLSFIRNQEAIRRSHYWEFYDFLRLDRKYIHLKYFQEIVFCLNWILPQKKSPQSIKEFYNGSQWWCLQQESIKMIDQFLKDKRNKDVIRLYKFSLCSDERIFQTVLKNIKGQNENKAILTNKTYITTNKKTNQCPKILDEEDFDNIQKSTALFARKFHYRKSHKLKERIQKELLISMITR